MTYRYVGGTGYLTSYKYEGTQVDVADVLPVPRCVLPPPGVPRRNKADKELSRNSLDGSLDCSPLASLRRQEERGRDEQAASRRDCIKLGLLASAWVGALAVSIFKNAHAKTLAKTLSWPTHICHTI